jgi:hypothetical protein
MFAGRRSLLFASNGRDLRQVAWPPGHRVRVTAARPLARIARGAIVDLAAVPGGVVALVTNRLHGHGWDRAPRLVVRRGGVTRRLTLPTAPASDVLAESLRVAWPVIQVGATDYAPSSGQAAAISWTSRDGGATWSVARSPS